MDDAQVESLLFGGVDELEQAAGVGRGHDGGAGGPDVLEFALQELIGHCGLQEVIDAGAAATPGAFGQLDQPQIGNGAQEAAGLGHDFLAVRQVAGLVVSHHLGRGAVGGQLEADLDEPLVDVFDLVVPEGGAVPVEGVVGEEVVVVLKVNAV